MFHTVAYYQSVDPASAYFQLTPIPDAVISVVAPKILVPSLNQIVALAAGLETTVNPRARIVAPSLLTMFKNQINPINGAAAAAVVPMSPQRVCDLRDSPLSLIVGEAMTAEIFSDPAAPQLQWVLAWLSDKALTPPPVEKFFTARATVTVAATAGGWSLATLTFDDILPRGRYSVQGFKAYSTSMVAARLIFVGQAWRPGCLGSILVTDWADPMFRWGGMGEFGQFEDIDNLQVEVLCNAADTAASQQFFIDLVQIRAGGG